VEPEVEGEGDVVPPPEPAHAGLDLSREKPGRPLAWSELAVGAPPGQGDPVQDRPHVGQLEGEDGVVPQDVFRAHLPAGKIRWVEDPEIESDAV
jgi:hypothetical protein